MEPLKYWVIVDKSNQSEFLPNKIVFFEDGVRCCKPDKKTGDEIEVFLKHGDYEIEWKLPERYEQTKSEWVDDWRERMGLQRFGEK